VRYKIVEFPAESKRVVPLLILRAFLYQQSTNNGGFGCNESNGGGFVGGAVSLVDAAVRSYRFSLCLLLKAFVYYIPRFHVSTQNPLLSIEGSSK
jgi:hypothetical protein